MNEHISFEEMEQFLSAAAVTPQFLAQCAKIQKHLLYFENRKTLTRNSEHSRIFPDKTFLCVFLTVVVKIKNRSIFRNVV